MIREYEDVNSLRCDESGDFIRCLIDAKYVDGKQARPSTQTKYVKDVEVLFHRGGTGVVEHDLSGVEYDDLEDADCRIQEFTTGENKRGNQVRGHTKITCEVDQ